MVERRNGGWAILCDGQVLQDYKALKIRLEDGVTCSLVHDVSEDSFLDVRIFE